MATTLSDSVEKMNADIEEIKYLIGLAKQDSVKSFLEARIKYLQEQIERTKFTNAPQVIASSTIQDTTKINFTTLKKFAWDQDPIHLVNFYITIPESACPLSKENVSVAFNTSSFDLRVTGGNKSNYRLVIPQLAGDIVPDDSSFVVKKKSIVIHLKKVNATSWSDVHASKTEAPLPTKTEGGQENAMQSMFNMMKDMYDKGDGEMKRTIAKAWTEGMMNKEQMG